MTRRDHVWLALMGCVFLAWHVPLMFRTTTGMDEEFYGVVGITILRDGVPRVPYVPCRERGALVYGVDVAVYTLPPLSFYLQALVHLLLGEGLGQARLASALEGLAATWLVYDLARRWLDDRRAAPWAAMLFLFGRGAYFPATTARPDMAATLFGLLSLWLLVRDAGALRGRAIAASGAAAGLSLLAHPMGIVPCCQVGLVLLARPGPVRERLAAAAIFAGAAGAAFSLWGLLIALHPGLFWAQFHANVLGRTGAGLSRTLGNPLGPFAFQARQFVARVMPVQAALYALGAAFVAVRARRAGPWGALGYHLAASSVLLPLLMGEHSLRAYFAYPAAIACVAAGGLASWAAGGVSRWTRRPALAGFATTAALAASLIPGSGIRTLAACVRHANDPAYDAHRFARRIMADLDPNALGAVDRSLVLDFYLAGRRVVDAHYLRFLPVKYDYLLVGPEGLRISRVPRESLELVRRYGNPGDEFAPYAELYRPARHAGKPAARSRRPAPSGPRWSCRGCGPQRRGREFRGARTGADHS